MHVQLVNIDLVYYWHNLKRRFDKHMWIFAFYSFTPAHFVSVSDTLMTLENVPSDEKLHLSKSTFYAF